VITNVATNTTRTASSNTDGDYEIPYLVPGTYKITCTASGFQTFIANDVALVGDEMRGLDMQLKIGSAESVVIVTAGQSVISTENAQISAGFTQTTYKDSPVSTQVFPEAQMVFLPQVQSEQGGFALTIAGLPPTQVEQSMDGIGNDGTNNLVNNAHTTEDLQVIASISPAEFSRSVNFTMSGKGGSNEFHGSASFDEVNSALNARFATEPTKPSFKTHFGDGEIGGPIRRDHTFFYVNYTLYRVPSSSFANENVPDQLERDGNFSEFTTPVINPYTGTQFQDNTIPSTMISSVSSLTQKNYIPLPNQGAPGPSSNNYGYLFPHPSDLYKYDSWNARVDHNFSSKHSLYGAYIDRISPYLLAGSFPAVGTWTRNRYHHSVVASDTYVISPTLLNNFRWGWALDHIHDGIPELGYTPPTGNVAVAAIGLEGVNPNGYKIMGFPNTTITGVSPLTESTGGIPLNSNDFTYNDSVTWEKGSHVIKVGGEVKPWTNATQQYLAGTYGTFTYDGSFSGNPYADFLLGLPRQSTRLNPLVSRTSHAHEFGIYAQDVFKLTPRLTVSYGLRWELLGFPTYDDGLVYNWDPATGDVIIPAGKTGKVSPLYPANITVVTGDAVPTNDKSLLRPRIGVAYRINDQFVVRGGYGLYTQALGNANNGAPIAQTLLTQPAPFSIAETYINQISDGQPLFSMPDPYPSSLSDATVPSQSVVGFPKGITNGKIHEFNVSIEREIHNIGLSIAYAGVRSQGMNYMVAQTNIPQPSLTPFSQSLRPHPQFVTTGYEYHNGKSNYDSLVLEAKRNISNFTFDVHYTYANNMDNWEELENVYNLNRWNHDQYTARNILTGMFIYKLPFGHGQRFGGTAPAVEDAVLGNWHLNWITTFQGGQFFTPSYSGSDPSNTNIFGGIPDRICNGNLSPGQRSPRKWFDASCFAVPQPGHFGDSGANILEAPPFNVSDMTLGKTFPVADNRVRMTFQGMFLDLFNTPTYAFPYSNISVPAQVAKVYQPLGGLNVGGGLVDAGGARAIVLRLRVEF
jgi:hypothetical protein